MQPQGCQRAKNLACPDFAIDLLTLRKTQLTAAFLQSLCMIQVFIGLQTDRLQTTFSLPNTHTPVKRPFVRDYAGEPVTER